ncbi:hypothetical protein B7P43_G04408 [Cryptotermes secundus]|uniref:Uncharacterized protein n=1 Tax=Cryptotermes secundus TaxID=105785 RepID=A0A2J7QJW9_9NEOP|nr:uncharacterized protein LOC111867083 [Cryptotermes secundus]PNF28870.1 hypothetical protein B7P43_G04408 [Cryptotermes secundus]PNF28871.1 hypothetical protein B7P43_G04408 [Cryptotermes secundus]PNF28872.1 hypothetical protein B7P43_G04408 [Cryptotermes secundus]
MPRCKQPQTLEAIALKVFSLYIRNVGCAASVCATHMRALQPNEDYDRIMLNMNCLAEFLYGALPRVLAEKMTRHVLDGIAQAMDETACTMDELKWTDCNKCRQVFEQMIVAGTSPHLTHLDLSPEPFHIRKVLCENLHKLLKLKVLIVTTFYGWELSNQTFVRDLSLLQNLVSFSMEHDCTDEIVHVLGQYCKQLICLNVTGAVGITDSSVENILKLKHLQQLHLSTTSVTESGFLQLLNGMIKVHQEAQSRKSDQSPGDRLNEPGPFSLKKLGCSFVRNSQLSILVEHFQCITQILLGTLQCDLSILKDLKHLKELKLVGGNFVTDNVKGLLEQKGSALQVLDMLLIQDVDLMLIRICCDELKVLSLRSCSFKSIVPHNSNEHSLKPFQKLEELTFYVQCSLLYLQFLLLSCRNIKLITVGLIREVDDKFIAFMLSINSMNCLENFKVYFSNHLTLHTVRLLMTCCPCLSVVGGLETWNGVSQEELRHFKEELKSSNLALSIVR